jgi:hypothetical protein
MRITRRIALAASGAACLLAAVGTGSALAVTAATSAPPPAKVGCVADGTRALVDVYENPAGLAKCPSGDFEVSLSAPGAPGAPGANAVVSSPTATLVSTDTSIATGGSFVTGATQIGSTVSLPAAGTYLLTFNAKAKGNDESTTADIFPQFFVYDQAANADFTGDLANFGAGAIEPATTGHDSYFSGAEQITVSGPTSLYVYAFGYDSDTGAGTYDLENATLTATQLNV